MVFISALLAGTALFLVILGAFPSRFLSETSEIRGDDDTFLKAIQELIVKKLSVRVRKYMSEGFERKVRNQLLAAGEPEGLRPEDILALMIVAAGSGVLFMVLILLMLKSSLTIALAGLIFVFLPRIWLNDQVSKRQFKVRRAIPYTLDLLTLSIEAGLDFTGAIGRVVEKGKDGPLKEEFSIMLNELKMGKMREDALRNLMDRVQLVSLNNVIRALIQADRMGTSLGKILRIQSTQLRIERTQRAEKLANEAPVKMLAPLIMCIFPTIFMILFGPIIYKFIS